jgi:hypothetical protein
MSRAKRTWNLLIASLRLQAVYQEAPDGRALSVAIALADSFTSTTSQHEPTLRTPHEAAHRIANTGTVEPLIFIEVQRGDYFGEDDIVRLEDDFGRADNPA